jgi:hypothetical protein
MQNFFLFKYNKITTATCIGKKSKKFIIKSKNEVLEYAESNIAVIKQRKKSIPIIPNIIIKLLFNFFNTSSSII